MKITIHFDGACDRNPGGTATYGAIIVGYGVRQILQGIAARGSRLLATCNVGEWLGVLRAVEWVHDHREGITSIDIYGDSKLVVKQLNLEWGCHADHLRPLRDRCLRLLGEIDIPWSIEWIPRERNGEADAISKEAFRCGKAVELQENKKDRVAAAPNGQIFHLLSWRKLANKVWALARTDRQKKAIERCRSEKQLLGLLVQFRRQQREKIGNSNTQATKPVLSLRKDETTMGLLKSLN